MLEGCGADDDSANPALGHDYNNAMIDRTSFKKRQNNLGCAAQMLNIGCTDEYRPQIVLQGRPSGAYDLKSST